MEWVKIDEMHLFLSVFFRPISLYARCGLFEQKKEHA